MPKEKVLNRDFGELLSSSARFEIPFFQRGYAWEQKQWKKLFEDIETEIIEAVEDDKFEDEEHFFGPIVVLEKIGDHPSLKRFLVIDGQQRITTVYLLLAVIRKLMEAKAHLSEDAQKYIDQLGVYLENKVTDEDDYLKLKVFSTKGDRLPTFKAVFDDNPSSPFLADDHKLYHADTNKVDAFVKYATRKFKGYDVPGLWQVYQALIKSLKIVWIPLDEAKDDPQAIFESLNDAGMPLSASELLCNYLFRPLTNEKTNEHEKLHNELWLSARKEVGTGEFEEYLRNLFSIGEKKRVGKQRRMYVHFKVKNKKISSDQARAVLQKIHDHTGVYNHIVKPIQKGHKNEKIKKLLISINNTNMSSCYPYMLAILKAHEDAVLTEADTIKLLRELYVLLVRRKVASLAVTKYDTFFPNLFNKILNEPDKVKAFHSQVQAEQLWVSDQVFEEAFRTKGMYNSRELNFSRLVLQEIDKAMQTHGELADYSTINTIEHVIPQTLDEYWKTYLGEDTLNINFPTIINTIGNLCLNSQSLNSHVGQNAFEKKQKAFTEVSALARDLKARQEPWNITAIEKRSQDLAKYALDVWKWSL